MKRPPVNVVRMLRGLLNLEAASAEQIEARAALNSFAVSVLEARTGHQARTFIADVDKALKQLDVALNEPSLPTD